MSTYPFSTPAAKEVFTTEVSQEYRAPNDSSNDPVVRPTSNALRSYYGKGTEWQTITGTYHTSQPHRWNPSRLAENAHSPGAGFFAAQSFGTSLPHTSPRPRKLIVYFRQNFRLTFPRKYFCTRYPSPFHLRGR